MSSSTTTTTKTTASAKTKATPNSGSYTVKIPTSAELSLALKKLWNGSYEDGHHRKQLKKVAKEHEQWMATLSRHSGILEDMEGEMKPVLVEMLMALMAFMEDCADGWWLLPTCFDMKGNTSIPFDCDDLVSLIDDLETKGIDVEDGDALAVLLYELGLYRDDMCGVVDSRKVLQAALELIEAGKADDAMVQLYNNLTGYANDHDFPDTELGEALNDPTEHPGVKLPVVETSKGLLWYAEPDALPMVVLYKEKRYDAGPFKMSKLPLDVLEDPVDTHENTDAKVSGCFKLEIKHVSDEGEDPDNGEFDTYRATLQMVLPANVKGEAYTRKFMEFMTRWARENQKLEAGDYDDGNFRIPDCNCCNGKVLIEILFDYYRDRIGWDHDTEWHIRQMMEGLFRSLLGEVFSGFKFELDDYRFTLKCNASDSNGSSTSDMDSNGSSMPALKRSASMDSNGSSIPALKRSASDMDSNGSSMPALKRSKSVGVSNDVCGRSKGL